PLVQGGAKRRLTTNWEGNKELLRARGSPKALIYCGLGVIGTEAIGNARMETIGTGSSPWVPPTKTRGRRSLQSKTNTLLLLACCIEYWSCRKGKGCHCQNIHLLQLPTRLCSLVFADAA